ncbi:hypothetical protein C2E20_3882 isoform A [Micractinium conductrix]|nr:hypothetical protein C2E20_3882 isoform A [Micractinium conductrix]|eukprot:PSC72668.1 hypothetical protein C2E20_3882 isoform A [Micractinium conductrix]
MLNPNMSKYERIMHLEKAAEEAKDVKAQVMEVHAMMAAAKDGGGAEEGEELLLAMAHLAMMVFNLAGLLGGQLNRYLGELLARMVVFYLANFMLTDMFDSKEVARIEGMGKAAAANLEMRHSAARFNRTGSLSADAAISGVAPLGIEQLMELEKKGGFNNKEGYASRAENLMTGLRQESLEGLADILTVMVDRPDSLEASQKCGERGLWLNTLNQRAIPPRMRNMASLNAELVTKQEFRLMVYIIASILKGLEEAKRSKEEAEEAVAEAAGKGEKAEADAAQQLYNAERDMDFMVWLAQATAGVEHYYQIVENGAHGFGLIPLGAERAYSEFTNAAERVADQVAEQRSADRVQRRKQGAAAHPLLIARCDKWDSVAALDVEDAEEAAATPAAAAPTARDPAAPAAAAARDPAATLKRMRGLQVGPAGAEAEQLVHQAYVEGDAAAQDALIGLCAEATAFNPDTTGSRRPEHQYHVGQVHMFGT